MLQQASTEHGRTDVDSMPDSIQEPEENENIKTTIEELEAVELFAPWPERKVYIGANLSHEMKVYLSNPPLLAKPIDGEKLLIYLAVSDLAVSAILVREDQGLGIVLVPPTGETIQQTRKCHPITNNEAEYEAVIAGLELARELGIEQVVIKSDSQLVVNQMLGTYIAREARMQQYLEKTRDLYGIVPEDKTNAQALLKKAARYCLKHDNLYRKIFGGPLARCLGPSQTEYVMREIYEGHCGNHAGGRSLVKTMIRAGYYWPKMEEDAENLWLNVTSAKDTWGMNIVGPLPQAKGKVRFLLVLTDYFTKWVEARAFKHVREKEVRDFIWRNIICRFGVPKEIVCDNGPQFIGTQITEFFQSWQIKRITSTPYHPVGNGQAESTNKVIINNLKKRLEESKGNWPEVLPGVLWAYCTTVKTSTGETPFSLVYGAEALIPVEIGEPSTRYTQETEE
ncbi:uncharacterized protein [Nicotiana sylvestris]|uniref:uncharacterized protein n=1 Tax=Nicotiana sylvestris TaxID=4096 RepID=UPI00388C7FA5